MIDPVAIRAGLEPGALVPITIYCYGRVGSTMDLAREAVQTLPPDALPVLIVADEQTAGRGRLGRRWVAPPGSALLFSLGLHPPAVATTMPVTLIWLATVALLETIEQETPLQAGLKWPNDVLVKTSTGWAKTAGILLEGGWDKNSLVWAIIGCGININAAPDPQITRYPATALAIAAETAIDRLRFLHMLMRRYDYWLRRLYSGESDQLWQTWRNRLLTLGQTVHIHAGNDLVYGTAIDVERNGSLIVREPGGTLRRLESGDVGLVDDRSHNINEV